MLDPHSSDVGEANTKDILEYLKLRMEMKFAKYDENTRVKIMSEILRIGKTCRRIVSLFSPTIYSVLIDPYMRFRWVVLQLAELEKCSSRYEMDKQLAELPKGLDEIYNQILKNIDEKHHADTRFIKIFTHLKRCEGFIPRSGFHQGSVKF